MCLLIALVLSMLLNETRDEQYIYCKCAPHAEGSGGPDVELGRKQQHVLCSWGYSGCRRAEVLQMQLLCNTCGNFHRE